eukprot:ctg_2067.g545
MEMERARRCSRWLGPDERRTPHHPNVPRHHRAEHRPFPSPLAAQRWPIRPGAADALLALAVRGHAGPAPVHGVRRERPRVSVELCALSESAGVRIGRVGRVSGAAGAGGRHIRRAGGGARRSTRRPRCGARRGGAAGGDVAARGGARLSRVHRGGSGDVGAGYVGSAAADQHQHYRCESAVDAAGVPRLDRHVRGRRVPAARLGHGGAAGQVGRVALYRIRTGRAPSGRVVGVRRVRRGPRS